MVMWINIDIYVWKKGKKKGTVISLQSFLANGDVPVGITQVAKKVRNLEGEESDDGVNTMPLVFQLPTAPRANRIFDDDSVPHSPPYIAYLTNLPFDAKEEDLQEFFGATPILSLRLPREEGETGRVRGFGYVEFENREDLINTLSLPDPSIKGRRIRIELSNESDNQGFRQRGNRRGFDGFNNSGENRESTNWRRDNNTNNSNDGYGKHFSRERKYEPDENKSNSSWRSEIRTNTNQSLESKFRNKDAERGISIKFRRDDQEFERPKLNLKPRTLPLPVVNKDLDRDIESIDENERKFKQGGVTSQKVFGSAKPVDTATRELEIEERMTEARRQQQLKQELDQGEINDKIGDIQLEKTNKDSTNYTTSWRRKDVGVQNLDNNSEGQSRGGLEIQKIESRRFNRDENLQIRNREYFDRDKTSYIQRDGKHKEENKIKRITKNERTFPKCQDNINLPVFQTSNKYAGLNDEVSE
ncbi:eukaryotic translation initiation factor 4B-like isoform X3 [Bactrocera neohumeralis]|uniref:eukaryotic translation initiation factor 4B-like isoform X3 n=1 Tax=Bactrocera neohumeralis TaxID=98809 RepID=UPI0021668DE8|nr:eukaryotic translation initiation factor 4B-like isoform X3 [Bactrocera neohumeralis]